MVNYNLRTSARNITKVYDVNPLSVLFAVCRFAVSSLGIISTTAQLDYEERSVYHLSLIAHDGGGTLTNPNQATTQIVIQVLDVNDHAPVCFPSATSVILEENQAYSNFLTISVNLLLPEEVFLHCNPTVLQ